MTSAWQAIWRPVAQFTRGICIFFTVTQHGAFVSKVDGPSMYPTFTGRGDMVFAECFPYICDRVKTGDVVIAIRPVAPDENIIKRVTAVQGEKVTFYQGTTAEPTTLQVPPGHVWLQGDNLSMSRDSREYGPVPLALVRGRVLLQLWPRVKTLEHVTPGRSARRG